MTLPEIYRKVLETDSKVDQLTNAIGELVAVNRRLDSHHRSIAAHDGRLDVLEQHKAIQDSRPRAPWWVVIGAVVGIVSGMAGLFAVLGYLGQIAQALN